MKPKYGNKKVTVDGYQFDSKAEATRWTDLKLMERAGQISGLKRQVGYVLCPAVKLGAAQRVKPAIKLIVDFQYRDERNGQIVLEDVKGVQTAVFRLKAHLLKDRYGMEVRIIK